MKCVRVLQVFVIVWEQSFPKEFHPYPYDDCTEKAGRKEENRNSEFKLEVRKYAKLVRETKEQGMREYKSMARRLDSKKVHTAGLAVKELWKNNASQWPDRCGGIVNTKHNAKFQVVQ